MAKISGTRKVIRRWKIKSEYLVNNKNKNRSTFALSQVILITCITVVVSFSLGFLISLSIKNLNISKEIMNFIEEYNELKNNYYDEIDDQASMKTAMEAIINSLDPYTEVVDDSLSNTLSTQLMGEYQGFGITVANDNELNVIVIGIVADSPAEKAGIQIYDFIEKIDDKEVVGMTTTEFADFVKKSNKETFELQIKRNNEMITLNIKREKVMLNSVASDIISEDNHKIGYIYVNVFALNTDKQFEKTLKEVEAKGIDSLIIDLRYNTGGHLSAVENMMSEFLDKSHVIYQIQTKEEITKYYSKTDTKRDYPIVVLVNESSASASEMFAACMQDEYGATIVGVTTFGKGTVQEMQDSTKLSDEYKLTTKKWLTPKGNWINGKGVTPDIEVELTDIENDNQLQEAIRVLKNKI